ncbi:hypothetical protein RN001_009356 [Aquatica leii]|uniref:Uncharacterized protein n=1 Tax=Aquatica leii TaxID=1421715 RepID=A0AAN7NZH4_9COLE|nr:hypothetical protein RN001_009356 [Aquatica leii]
MPKNKYNVYYSINTSRKCQNKMLRKGLKEYKIWSQINRKFRTSLIEKNKGMKSLKQEIGRKQIYALRNKHGIVIHDRDEILKIVEEFYTELYKSQMKYHQENKKEKEEERKIENVGSEEQPDITIEEV